MSSDMDINAIAAQVDSEIQHIRSAQSLEEFRVKYLGRKGLLSQLTATIAGISPEERSAFGKQVNSLKQKIIALLEEKESLLGASKSAAVVGVDIGMPGIVRELGRLHPVTRVIGEICSIFTQMGFSVMEGPEIETEYNNFTGLNIPLEHPSRDVFDTFYIKPSAVGSQPPAVPGRVYRPDAVDASHSFMFHQIEGFMVDKGIRFSDLKGVLEVFARAVFGEDIKMRFRPHFFPFTEPSAEVDISCIICKGQGCSVCGRKGWLEILGSGMIHPNVFRQVGYDAKAYTGFAFGLGIERIAMLKYGIDDIRLFFENDLRFLNQF